MRSIVLLVMSTMLSCSGVLAAQMPRGHLFIVGGGTQAPQLIDRFVELAGGKGRARIAVVPLASESPQETGDEKVRELEEHGASAFTLVVSRRDADDSAIVTRLAGVTGVWFSGGDQIRITRIVRGTRLQRELLRRYRDGIVIGGTSAGAAIMTDSMLTGQRFLADGDTAGYYGDEYPTLRRHEIEVVPGLGFLTGAIVDQHFVRRERFNRLLSAVLERPTLLGAGIDEGTVLDVAPDGCWRTLGAGDVLIIDPRHGRTTRDGLLGGANLALHVLPPGSSFSPSTGRATLADISSSQRPGSRC